MQPSRPSIGISYVKPTSCLFGNLPFKQLRVLVSGYLPPSAGRYEARAAARLQTRRLMSMATLPRASADRCLLRLPPHTKFCPMCAWRVAPKTDNRPKVANPDWEHASRILQQALTAAGQFTRTSRNFSCRQVFAHPHLASSLDLITPWHGLQH